MDVSRTIDKLDKHLFCSGCGACYNICPKDAISMQYNKEGFHEPVIDPEKCISCGMCEKVCPAFHPKKDNNPEPDIYAVKGDKKILKESTSGGVFAILSEYILSKEGYVCGAAYNDSFEVWHSIENTPEGVKKLKRSKYVQCQTGLVFRELKKLLEEDKWVLFSGTPCQVAGFHNYLGKSYEKLYTMDIVCHGCPAPMTWKRYVEENLDTTKVKDIEFRHKGDHGFKKSYMALHYKNGKEEVMHSNKNPYYFHFRKNLGLRMSCTACQGAVVPRVGDFSAGDFWGAEKFYPELIESDSGLSLIYFNNEHAKELMPYLKERFVLMQKITLSEAMAGNRSKVTRKMHVNRDRFFHMMKTETFNEAIRKNIGVPFDIAVYGNTLGTNYGGVITYYALYKALVNMGYGVVMVRPPKKNTDEPKSHSVKFFEENVVLSDELPFGDFKKYNKIANTFVLGSDQVWNYKLFKGRRLSFYLDFVEDKKKKVAYAASYGFEKPTIFPEYENLYPVITKLMKRFDAIGVRESDGVNICKDYFGVGATHVMDPVFLIRPEEYLALAEKAKRKPEGKYMAVYALTPKDNLNNGLQFVSGELGLPRVNMGPGNAKKFKKKSKNFDEPYMKNVVMEEWLYNIAHSDFVMTDSYHCVCFSIIFRKNFILIQDAWAVSRIKSLLTKLNLTDRWFESSEDLKNNPEILTKDIDYDAVYEILRKEIDESWDWLRKAVSTGKSVTTVDKVSVDSSVKSDYRKLFSSLTGNMYLKALEKNQKDFVVAVAVKGSEVKELKAVKAINKRFELNEDNSCIFDASAKTFGKTIIRGEGKFSNIAYEADGTIISVASDASAEEKDNEFTELSAEINGKRQIITCEKEGIHILVYSKKHKQVVDYVRIDKRNIIHR